MKKKQSFFWAIILIFFCLLSIPIFLKYHKQNTASAQQNEDPAALILIDAPTLPSNLDQEFSLNLNSGEEFDLFVYLKANSQSLVAADVEIDFDPNVIELDEINGKTNANLFPLYIEPVDLGWLDAGNGKINLSGVTFDLNNQQPTEAVSDSGEFARFTIKVKNDLSPQVTQISFNPQTIDPQNNLSTDSNLVSLVNPEEVPQDILGQVKNFQLIINQPGDINGDFQVNLADIMTISQNFQLADYKHTADYNRDGQVDLTDLMIVAQNFNNSY